MLSQRALSSFITTFYLRSKLQKNNMSKSSWPVNITSNFSSSNAFINGDKSNDYISSSSDFDVRTDTSVSYKILSYLSF